MDNEAFKKQLDELFRLFNRLMEKHPIDEVPGINRMQLEQMRLFLKNYELMKDQITFEMMGQMNEPVRQMIGMFIKQLREELGEEDYTEVTFVPPATKPDSLEAIDEMLRRPGLSEEEIDRLLDERAGIVNRQKGIMG